MKLLLISLFFIFSTESAKAIEYGCQLRPGQLNEVATRMVKKMHQEKKSLPNALTITAEFSGEWNSSTEETQDSFELTAEGFYRPDTDDYYAITPIPILGVTLSRDRDVVYICTHIDSDPRKTHFTAYMMRGYDLDPLRIGNIIGNIFSSTKLEVKPLATTLLGISSIRKKLLPWLKWIPLFEMSLQSLHELERLVFNALGDFTKIGVERITLTANYIELASGVNLNEPSKAKYLRKIDF